MANRSQCLMSSVDQHHQQQIQMESASATTQAASNFSPSAPSSDLNTTLNFDLPSGSSSEHCRSTGTLPTPVAGTPQDPEESSFCGGQQLQQNQTCSNPPVSDPSVSETPAAATRYEIFQFYISSRHLIGTLLLKVFKNEADNRYFIHSLAY